MRNTFTYHGMSDRVLAQVEAAGLDLAPLLAAPRLMVRLPKGKQLHAPDCNALKGRSTVDVEVPAHTVHRENVHDVCTRWSSSYPSAVREYCDAAGTLGVVHAGLVSLEASSHPLHHPLATLRARLRDEDVEDAARLVFGSDDELRDLQRRADVLAEAWSSVSREDRCRPFLVQMVSCPRESVHRVGAPAGAGAWRLVEPAWRAWQLVVSEEGTFDAARAAARERWVSVARGFELAGERLDVDVSGLDRAVDLWEEVLGEACAVAGPDVVLAVTYAGAGAEAIGKAMSVFAGCVVENGRDAFALRVPEAVGEWLCSQPRLRSPLWLGSAEGDSPAVLETFAALWNPSGFREALSSAQAALETARFV